jgi:hypothetical protein
MDELEARMQGRERLMRFRLEQIPPTAQVGIDARIREIGHGDWRVVAVTEDIMRLTKGQDGNEVIVPLAYVEAVYHAEEPSAEWVIRLPCFIAQNRETKRLYLWKELPRGHNLGDYAPRGY